MATIEEVKAELARRQGVTAQQVQAEIARRSQPQEARQSHLIALQDLLVRQSQGEQGLEDQIAQIRQQTGAQDVVPTFAQDLRPVTALEEIQGGVEGFLGLGSQIVAEPIAGIAGLAAAADPFGEEFAGAKTVRKVKDLLTFKPGRLGEEAIQNLSEPIKPVGEKLLKLRNFLGDDAFEATGSPALAAMATALPDALLETIGGGLSRRATTSAAQDVAVEPAKRTAVESIQQAEEATGIRRLTTDVIPPQSKGSKFMQQQGEFFEGAVEAIGLGQAKRTAQQAERLQAVERLFESFDVTDGARYEAAIFDSMTQSINAQKRAAGVNFDLVVNRLNQFGNVQIPRTIQIARRELQKQQRGGSIGDQATIRQMENIINSPQNLRFEDIKSFRSSIGRQLDNARMKNPVTGSDDTALLSQIYRELTNDMTDFATRSDSATAREWRRADRVFSDFATGADKSVVRSIIKRGDATPEAIDQLLFSKKNSDIEFLANNLTREGLEIAKQRLLQKPLNKMIDKASGEINPSAFIKDINSLRNQIGRIFSPDERRGIFALRDALNQTRQAQIASVATQTGQQVVPLFAFVNPKIVIPGVAQAIIEKPALRNLLIKRNAAKTAKQRFNIDSQLQAEIDKLGLSAAASTGAVTAQAKEEDNNG